ncbi:MAG: hypothetical protein ABW023_09745 [Sphingomonas sp.]
MLEQLLPRNKRFSGNPAKPGLDSGVRCDKGLADGAKIDSGFPEVRKRDKIVQVFQREVAGLPRPKYYH